MNLKTKDNKHKLQNNTRKFSKEKKETINRIKNVQIDLSVER